MDFFVLHYLRGYGARTWSQQGRKLLLDDIAPLIPEKGAALYGSQSIGYAIGRSGDGLVWCAARAFPNTNDAPGQYGIAIGCFVNEPAGDDSQGWLEVARTLARLVAIAKILYVDASLSGAIREAYDPNQSAERLAIEVQNRLPKVYLHVDHYMILADLWPKEIVHRPSIVSTYASPEAPEVTAIPLLVQYVRHGQKHGVGGGSSDSLTSGSGVVFRVRDKTARNVVFSSNDASDLRREIQSLKDTITQLEKDKGELRDEITRLEASIQVLNDLNGQLSNRIGYLGGELESKAGELRNTQAKLADALRKLDDLSYFRKLNWLQRILAHAFRFTEILRFEELERDLEQRDAALADAKNRLASVTSERDLLSRQLEDLRGVAGRRRKHPGLVLAVLVTVALLAVIFAGLSFRDQGSRAGAPTSLLPGRVTPTGLGGSGSAAATSSPIAGLAHGATPSASPTPSRISTHTATPTPTPTASPSPTPSQTPSPTPTPTPTRSPSPTVSASPSATSALAPAASPNPTAVGGPGATLGSTQTPVSGAMVTPAQLSLSATITALPPVTLGSSAPSFELGRIETEGQSLYYLFSSEEASANGIILTGQKFTNHLAKFRESAVALEAPRQNGSGRLVQRVSLIAWFPRQATEQIPTSNPVQVRIRGEVYAYSSQPIAATDVVGVINPKVTQTWPVAQESGQGSASVVGVTIIGYIVVGQ